MFFSLLLLLSLSTVAKSGQEELGKDNEALRSVNAKLQEALDAFQVKYRKTTAELDHAHEISAKSISLLHSLLFNCSPLLPGSYGT